MDTNFLFVLAAIALVFLIALLVLLIPSKKDKEYKERLKRNLEDEHLYDPETGRKITLEEAQSGFYNTSESQELSDEDASYLMREEEQDYRAVRLLFDEEIYQRVEEEDREKLAEEFEHFEFDLGMLSFSFDWLIQLTEEKHIGVAYSEYYIPDDPKSYRDEKHLIALIKSPYAFGKAIMIKKRFILSTLEKKLHKENFRERNGQEIKEFGEVNQSAINKIADAVHNLPEYRAIFDDKCCFIRIPTLPNQENAQKLLSTLESIKLKLSKLS